MLRIAFNSLAKRSIRLRWNTQKSRNLRRTSAFEQLGQRLTPTVNAFFTAGNGQLTILGDALDNTIVVSRDASGTIQVNGGAV